MRGGKDLEHCNTLHTTRGVLRVAFPQLVSLPFSLFYQAAPKTRQYTSTQRSAAIITVVNMVKLYTSLLALTFATSLALASYPGAQFLHQRDLDEEFFGREYNVYDDLEARDPFSIKKFFPNKKRSSNSKSSPLIPQDSQHNKSFMHRVKSMFSTKKNREEQPANHDALALLKDFEEKKAMGMKAMYTLKDAGIA